MGPLIEKKHIQYSVPENLIRVTCKVTVCICKLHTVERKGCKDSFVFQGWSCVPADCSRDQYQLMGQRREQEHSPALGSMFWKQGYYHIFDRWVKQKHLEVITDSIKFLDILMVSQVAGTNTCEARSTKCMWMVTERERENKRFLPVHIIYPSHPRFVWTVSGCFS